MPSFPFRQDKGSALVNEVISRAEIMSWLLRPHPVYLATRLSEIATDFVAWSVASVSDLSVRRQDPSERYQGSYHGPISRPMSTSSRTKRAWSWMKKSGRPTSSAKLRCLTATPLPPKPPAARRAKPLEPAARKLLPAKLGVLAELSGNCMRCAIPGVE
jgi:hypothetical protein